MHKKFRSVGLSGAAVVLVAGAQATLGLWPQAVLADSPNCAEYQTACAQYNQQSSTGIIVAAVIILAAVLIAAAVLTVVIVRRQRRRRVWPPPSGPAPTNPAQPR
jgi:heme/copper-type cytochrome/quinol oxidase subunit 2